MKRIDRFGIGMNCLRRNNNDGIDAWPKSDGAKHDPRVEALVYIISSKGKSIFYGTDMLEISEEAWKILENHRFDVVFMDQTYGKGFNAGGHPDAGMVSDYVKTMKKKGIIDEKTFVYATHISHEGNATHEEMEQDAEANGYRIAYDGMKLYLK